MLVADTAPVMARATLICIRCASENDRVRNAVNAGNQFGVLSAAFFFQAAGFRSRSICMMRGSSFTNRMNADYSERIGDTVGYGCQR